MQHLLIDHPALRIPVVSSAGITFEAPVALNEAMLGHKDRLRCAAQVLALSALLTEFDLWLPRWAVRQVIIIDKGAGKQVIVGGFPTSLSRLYHRLGGGETAAQSMRDAIVRSVCDRFRISLPDEAGALAQGFFLDPVLEIVLKRIGLPLDRRTAANLWAVKWACPQLPEDGEITFVSLPDRGSSMRVGAALWARLRRENRQAWLREVADDGAETAPYPGFGLRGTLILVGVLTEQEILAVERWVRLEGCSACVLGVFPKSWTASNSLGEISRAGSQLSVVGGSRACCRIEIERRSHQRFADSAVERDALTTLAQTLFAPSKEIVPEPISEPAKRVLRLLSLLPEGLPEGFISCYSETQGQSLELIMASLPVAEDNCIWRLVAQRPLLRDPLHLEVSGLFTNDDPRRLRHRVLGGDAAGDLIEWVRSRMNDLDGDAVRALLNGVGPGELGRELQLLQIEACLSELDPAGARIAAEGLDPKEYLAHEAWFNAIDGPAGWRLDPTIWDDLCLLPAAAAEVALYTLRTAEGETQGVEERLSEAISKMHGLQRRWYEIEAASILENSCLEDWRRRRDLTGRHPKLRRHLLRKLALRYMRLKNYSKAERAFKYLAAVTSSPGRLALIYQDLSGIESETNREESSVWRSLKVLRLFETAGFHNRSRNVIFNLAVSDIDHLELERAEGRLEKASGGKPDIFAKLETARLALAQGDEERFGTMLRELERVANAGEGPIREALRFLKGVEDVLQGDFSAAITNLSNGGQEGQPWLDIVDALQGRKPEMRDDYWGLHTAAKMIYDRGRGSLAAVPFDRGSRIEDALAFAVVARLDRVPVSPQIGLARRLLERRGMEGWARCLRVGDHISHGYARGLVTLVEGGLLPDLAPEAASEIFSGIGITGLELRSSDGEVLWVCGEGEPGTERRRGRLVFVPLGGDPVDNVEWRLLTGVLEVTTPLMARTEEVDASKTGILGISGAVRDLRSELMAYAPTDATVLLLGETGVGKDVAARALHHLSGRRGLYQAINVAGIPENLIEAELFGAVRGAYTGSDRNRKGIVETVDGGTLFLDEIGDLGLPMQVKLLRFIESREVRPVGSDRTHVVDVRIVAATHRDLEARIEQGLFREDLYYRISTAPITIPPLRDRRPDILLLRDYFEREFCARNGLQLCRWSLEAEATLQSFEWPGNIRQLKNAVDGAIVRSQGSTIRPEMLKIGESRSVTRRGTWEEVQADFRREYLTEALNRHGGNRSATARELGISRQALLYQIKALHLK